MTHAGPPLIRTPRLTLRPLRPEDAPAIVEGVGRYDVARWLSVVPYPYGQAEAEAFLASPDAAPGVTWGIEAGGALCGIVSTRGELGFWLARPAWGQGYATEAGDAAIDAHFADPAAADLTAGHFLDNARSARVLGKLGFLPSRRTRRAAKALGQEVESCESLLTRTRWAARRRYHVETDRLVIRTLVDGDWPDLQRLAGVPEVARMTGSIPAPWPEDQVRAWIAARRYRGRPGFAAALCLSDGTLIGTLGIGRMTSADPMTCGYWLGQPYWGRGYATEAMVGLLADCYDRFAELDVIEAGHFTDNPASGAVLRKLGFQQVGEGMGRSRARLEPQPELLYRLTRAAFEARR